MKNLIIVGNGFDLAHNLKTTYYDFIKDLIENKASKDKSAYRAIADFTPIAEDIILEKFQNGNCYPNNNSVIRIDFKNKFIGSLIMTMKDKRWCDIENIYFKQLTKNYHEPNISPKELNTDFEDVKTFLSNYLVEEEKNANKINCYNKLFERFANIQLLNHETLILNFNYTRVLEKLYSDVIKCPILHIHGELENEKNPIIFGYAANQEEINTLLSHDDNEFLKNIKMYWYNKTNNKNKLNDFLKPSNVNSPNVNVIILGHSIGLSDKLILNEIFNSESIFSIRIFFYENDSNYDNTQMNISRIMANHDKFGKIIKSCEDSHRMPQHNDNENQVQEFVKYLNKIESPS
jgi:hypothetical protein